MDNGDGTYSFDPSDPAVVVGDNTITYELSTSLNANLLGQEIYGLSNEEFFGAQTDLNRTGNVLVIGAPDYDNERGLVRVYTYNDATNYGVRGDRILLVTILVID